MQFKVSNTIWHPQADVEVSVFQQSTDGTYCLKFNYYYCCCCCRHYHYYFLKTLIDYYSAFTNRAGTEWPFLCWSIPYPLPLYFNSESKNLTSGYQISSSLPVAIISYIAVVAKVRRRSGGKAGKHCYQITSRILGYMAVVTKCTNPKERKDQGQTKWNPNKLSLSDSEDRMYLTQDLELCSQFY